ncbi:putative quinol monooxygenase [Ramlibacter sp. WS9]|uniref:putative quinol monooxygenase n=1 Tax=Ramlibacter sp. WS9 TaxID=1882741 RepID=UPI0011432043|nr:putative quinol monooxygenase [Ramlibacter sp. WS9]ROZ63890.1 antibiotic biosynthesis monooxygenase [Ramlibacter sp. WS9]
MIVVIGSASVRGGREEQALALSLEHVKRSRGESGCISHSVHRDAESPSRLVFLEQWEDLASLQAHFQVAASRQFGKALAELCDSPPTLQAYDAGTIDPFRRPAT